MRDCVKIIIPIYNTEKYLERCLDSVQSQTYQDITVILVDDGSTDSCPSICDRFTRKDSRFRTVHQANHGLSFARNVGIDLSNDGGYLTFVDSDDWLHPTYIEALLSAVKNTGVPMAICRHARVRNQDASANSELFMPPRVRSSEECYCMTDISTTPAWGKLYHSSLFESLRFPIGKIHEDYYVTWKALFRAEKIAVVPSTLYFYFYNPSGIMHSQWTPKRMDFFPAIIEKIQYFRSNQFYEAAARATKKMNGMIDKYIGAVAETSYATEYLPLLEQWHDSLREGQLPIIEAAFKD